MRRKRGKERGVVRLFLVSMSITDRLILFIFGAYHSFHQPDMTRIRHLPFILAHSDDECDDGNNDKTYIFGILILLRLFKCPFTTTKRLHRTNLTLNECFVRIIHTYVCEDLKVILLHTKKKERKKDGKERINFGIANMDLQYLFQQRSCADFSMSGHIFGSFFVAIFVI